ncbi:MAG: cation:proton antiporter [Pseudomonadota bacterium]|nr:cation:proton antiporter [Pseudomonadota bacterium]
MLVLLTFTAMLLVALIVEPLAEGLRLPFGAALVAVGFAGSELLVYFGIDTGLRWHVFTDLILELFLPLLVFGAAFNLDARRLLRDIVPILYLAVPLFIVSALVTATLIYFGIGHPGGFPWITALLAGALLSATDPGAVVAIYEKLGLSDRVKHLLEGESLFNDATAIVLFGLLLSLATLPETEINAVEAGMAFLKVFFGGLAVGAITGIIGVGLMFTFRGPFPCAVISFSVVIFSVYLSGNLFQVSPVMAVLAAGLITGAANLRICHEGFVNSVWGFVGYVIAALMFLLMGATVTPGMFTAQWLAILIGIGAVVVSRALTAWILLPPATRMTSAQPLSRGERTLVFWGGLRGAVTLALALQLPLELDAWFTVQSIAYGVVLFNLFFQAPLMEPLLRRLGSQGTEG